MKKSILTTVLIWFSISSLCYAVEPVKISVDLANPPFMYVKNGKAAGLYPFLVQEVFRKMEIPVTIQPLPWKRAIKEADAGQAGIAGIYKNPEREKKYDYSQALFQEKLVIFVRKENLFSYQKIDDLKGKKIGVIRGWSYGEKFDTAREKGMFVVEEAKGDAQNFKKLLRNRIDCVIDRFRGEFASQGMDAHDGSCCLKEQGVPRYD